MENFIRKVIRASAGTGKTYRLSLEYIGLLLQFKEHNISFNEILVITFTKKATAEIRENIFNHLREIIDQSEKGAELCSNLSKYGGIELNPGDIEYLKQVYHEMLIHKDQVQISTIDSFTNMVFRTMIAPYLGLSNYDIDNKIDKSLLAEIYSYILSDRQILDKLKNFFVRSGRRKIEDYENLFKSIIDNRWMLHIIRNNSIDISHDFAGEDLAIRNLTDFQRIYSAVLDDFADYVKSFYTDLTLKELVKRDYYNLVHSYKPLLNIDIFIDQFKHNLENEDFIYENHSLFLNQKTFWDGRRIFRKKVDSEFTEKLKSDLGLAFSKLADYFFFKYIIPEQKDIQEIAEIILKRYDLIKFRNKVFTYNDISYYTFKYLYDPKLSLIDKDYVNNAFYEYLSTALRFILIDEFQDTSVIQFKILLPIIKEVTSGIGAKNYGGTIVVGDEKQSIYGWRGGERDLLLRMPGIMESANIVTLDTSYRSKKNIVTFINKAFSNSVLHDFLDNQEIEWPYQTVKTIKNTDSGYIKLRLRNYSDSKNDENDISQEEDVLREFVEQEILPLINENKISARNTVVLARKNRELRFIASILDESGIDYILESSHSIIHHQAIKPLMYLYHFIAYRDVYNLLKFMRSDLILMNSKDLKELLITYRDMNNEQYDTFAYFRKLDHISSISKLSSLIFNHENSDTDLIDNGIFIFTKQVIEAYNITGVFNQENDIKNINFFLQIILNFEKTNSEYPKTLKGFLDYCQENETHESFQQRGLENINALSLMTIHKSKGLEFNNVFFYWNISGKEQSSTGRLNYFLDYETDFGHVKDWALIFNFKQTFSESHKHYLMKIEQQKMMIEELNNFYVALTRPKTNLFINLAYKKSGGITKLMNDTVKEDSPAVDRIFALSMYRLFKNEFNTKTESQHSFIGDFGTFNSDVEKNIPGETTDFTFISEYCDLNHNKWLDQNVTTGIDKNLDFKTIYIRNKNIELGNLVHYYLSYIYYATEQEKQYAEKRTISYYGNLIQVSEIKKILNKVNHFITTHAMLFSAEKWSKVFTEYILFDSTGREIRLDRMMVDETKKNIFIIDYKTGENYDEDQIKNYIKAVKSLNIVKKQQFHVRGEFFPIDIG